MPNKVLWPSSIRNQIYIL